MLQKLGKKVRRIWSRLRLRALLWRTATRKVVIRRFSKQNPMRMKRVPSLLGMQRGNQTAPDRIRVASFNVAMFSLAPAIARSDGKWVESVGGSGPKSILKQSPAVGQEHLPKKVWINLPENEISMAQNHRVLRSPICMALMDDGSSSRSILEVLKEVDADIVALQDVKAEEEKGMKPLSDLALALGMYYVFAESWAPEYGNAILSKWEIKRSKVQKICDDQDFRNVLKATIDVPRTGELNFYCTQLDHLDEDWRMKQINAIIKSNDHPHLLAGGINSLTASDYSFDRWNNILKYYQELGKPTPRTDVTNFLHQNSYTDAKHFAGDCESAVIITKGQNVQGSCKYGTRVDYILASKGLAYTFVPGSYSVVSSKGTSDHHIVKVDLVKLHKSPQVSRTNKTFFQCM